MQQVLTLNQKNRQISYLFHPFLDVPSAFLQFLIISTSFYHKFWRRKYFIFQDRRGKDFAFSSKIADVILWSGEICTWEKFLRITKLVDRDLEIYMPPPSAPTAITLKVKRSPYALQISPYATCFELNEIDHVNLRSFNIKIIAFCLLFRGYKKISTLSKFLSVKKF